MSYVSGRLGPFRAVWPVWGLVARFAGTDVSGPFFVNNLPCFIVQTPRCRFRVGLARFGSCGPFPRERRVGPVYVYDVFEATLFCNIKGHVVGLGSVWPVSVRAARFTTEACRARLCQNLVTSLNIPFACDFYIKKCHV